MNERAICHIYLPFNFAIIPAALSLCSHGGARAVHGLIHTHTLCMGIMVL
jgi:hypothetical protein